MVENNAPFPEQFHALLQSIWVPRMATRSYSSFSLLAVTGQSNIICLLLNQLPFSCQVLMCNKAVFRGRRRSDIRVAGGFSRVDIRPSDVGVGGDDEMEPQDRLGRPP